MTSVLLGQIVRIFYKENSPPNWLKPELGVSQPRKRDMRLNQVEPIRQAIFFRWASSLVV